MQQSELAVFKAVLEETVKSQGQGQKENFSSSTKENKYSAGKQNKDQQYSILEKCHDKQKGVQVESLKYLFPDPAWSETGSAAKDKLRNTQMQRAIRQCCDATCARDSLK